MYNEKLLSTFFHFLIRNKNEIIHCLKNYLLTKYIYILLLFIIFAY